MSLLKASKAKYRFFQPMDNEMYKADLIVIFKKNYIACHGEIGYLVRQQQNVQTTEEIEENNDVRKIPGDNNILHYTEKA